MLVETTLAIAAFGIGLVIKKQTSKEIKQHNRIITLTPLIISGIITLSIIFQNPNWLPLVLIGFVLSILFNTRNEKSQLVFATVLMLSASVEKGVTSIFVIYFMIKGSLSNNKPSKAITMILLGAIAFLGVNFVKTINAQTLAVFSSLFAGAVLGGEAILDIKLKNKNKRSKK